MGTKGYFIIQGPFDAIVLRIQSDAHPGEIFPILKELVDSKKEFNNSGRLAEWLMGEFNAYPSTRIAVDAPYLNWIFYDNEEHCVSDFVMTENHSLSEADIYGE